VVTCNHAADKGIRSSSAKGAKRLGNGGLPMFSSRLTVISLFATLTLAVLLAYSATGLPAYGQACPGGGTDCVCDPAHEENPGTSVTCKTTCATEPPLLTCPTAKAKGTATAGACLKWKNKTCTEQAKKVDIQEHDWDCVKRDCLMSPTGPLGKWCIWLEGAPNGLPVNVWDCSTP
jgi:hypothetical protein